MSSSSSNTNSKSVSSRKRKATIISDVVIVPKKCSEKKKKTTREPEQPEESLIDLIASIAPADFVDSLLPVPLPETVVEYSLGDSLMMPSTSSSASSTTPSMEGAMQPTHHTEMNEASMDGDTTPKVIIIDDDEDDNVQFAQNAQPHPTAEEDFKVCENWLKKLDIFKNGVAEDFNIPSVWIPTDNSRCLLAVKFRPLNITRTIFALVGLDPTKNFNVVFRVTDKRNNKHIQFECFGEFMKNVKRVLANKTCSARTDGVNIALKNGQLCLCSSQYSIYLNNSEIEDLFKSERFLFFKSLELDSKSSELDTDYKKIYRM